MESTKRRVVRLCLSIVAWLGLAIMALAASRAFDMSITHVTAPLEKGVRFEWYVYAWAGVMMAGSFGALLVLLGGLIARPGSVFIVSSALIGALYIASFFGVDGFRGYSILVRILLWLLPGLACVAVSIVLYWFKRKRA